MISPWYVSVPLPFYSGPWPPLAISILASVTLHLFRVTFRLYLQDRGCGYDRRLRDGFDLILSFAILLSQCGCADAGCQSWCWLIGCGHVGTALFTFFLFSHVPAYPVSHKSQSIGLLALSSWSSLCLALSRTHSWPLLLRQHRPVLAFWTHADAATPVVMSLYFFIITQFMMQTKVVDHMTW